MSQPLRRLDRFSLAMLTAGLMLALAGQLLTAPSAQAKSTLRDFESDPVGSVPTGCTTPSGAAAAVVTDRQSHQGKQSLQLTDNSTTQQTVVNCPTTDRPGADLRFAIRPEQLSNGFLITLLGHFEGESEHEEPVFQVQVKPDGSLFWFDGLTQDDLGWTQIAAAGTVADRSWSTLTLQVPTSHRESRIYRGDRPSPRNYLGAAGPVGVTPVAAVTSFQFASHGTESAGDSVLIDEVIDTDGARALPAPRHPDFRIGRPTIIDQTDEGLMQMPNTAVSVERRDGPDEVLVGYPVHGDATHDTGTALASSTDNGRTWTEADERNPFPDEQSFYLSRLRNGDLLAVSYHTFMIEDSDGRQAEVPTAVSSDGGRTWSHRAGRMTAPQAMRPISDGTSRPGHPLGGFVLVHRVVEDRDGTLYQSGYGYYRDDPKYRQIILASTDGGQNWTVRGTVAVDPELSDHPRYEGFCEGAIVRAADGSLLTVMRTGNYQSLYQSRSTDDGATWSEPVPVTTGRERQPVVGVFPDLVRMGNGTLVLYIGRPGQSVLAATDGVGDEWSAPAMVDYLNSGNGTQLPIADNRLLTFGDRGADWTPNVPQGKGIWAIPIKVGAR